MQVFIAAATLALGCASSPTIDPTVSARLDTAIAPYVDAGEFQGVVLAARDGDLLHAKGYGVALAGDPAVPDPRRSIFPIGSVTKQFTAAIAFRLEEEGALDLSAPVSAYLPEECPAVSATVLEVLGHTAGLAKVERPRRFYVGEPDTDASARAADVCGRRAKAKGGARFRYAQSDYEVATAVLEAATGRPYADLVETYLVKPLGLERTGLHEPGVEPKGRAAHFEGEPGARDPIEGYRFENYLGGAGLYSTADELRRLDEALLAGDIVSEESFSRMTEGRPRLGYAAYGAWAWPWTGSDGETRTVIQRHGWVGAFATLNLILPEDRTILVIMSNVGPGAGLQTLWTGEGMGAEALAALYAAADGAEE